MCSLMSNYCQYAHNLLNRRRRKTALREGQIAQRGAWSDLESCRPGTTRRLKPNRVCGRDASVGFNAQWINEGLTTNSAAWPLRSSRKAGSDNRWTKFRHSTVHRTRSTTNAKPIVTLIIWNTPIDCPDQRQRLAHHTSRQSEIRPKLCRSRQKWAGFHYWRSSGILLQQLRSP